MTRGDRQSNVGVAGSAGKIVKMPPWKDLTPRVLMFHHFCGEGFPRFDGDWSREELETLLDRLPSAGFQIWSASDWLQRQVSGTLRAGDLALSFDDGIRSQLHCALPALRERKLCAFFFVYTAWIADRYWQFEAPRLFRAMAFTDKEAFYEAFDQVVARDFDSVAGGALPAPSDYLSEHVFYSLSDRRFRWMRDHVLGAERFATVIRAMMEARHWDPEASCEKFLFDESDIKTLASEGHVIGNHSHRHLNILGQMPSPIQRFEYGQCREWLRRWSNQQVEIAAYPTDSFGPQTTQVLASLSIRAAFCAHITPGTDPYRLPREDVTLWKGFIT